jgi:hypothetical protein
MAGVASTGVDISFIGRTVDAMRELLALSQEGNDLLGVDDTSALSACQ